MSLFREIRFYWPPCDIIFYCIRYLLTGDSFASSNFFLNLKNHNFFDLAMALIKSSFTSELRSETPSIWLTNPF